MGMDCPNCGGRGTAVNEIDDSICCDVCGTVLQEFDLIDYEENRVYRKDRQKEVVVKTPFLESWFEKVGVFFNFEGDLMEQGKELIKQYGQRVPRKFINEACLGIICSIGKDLKPGWTVDDYIAAFPHALFKPALLKIYILVEGPGLNTTQAMCSSESQFEYSMDKIYSVIEKQLFGSSAVPAVFNKGDLKTLTSQFMELSRMYGLNVGKKARSLITVSACVCALYLRTKIPLKKRKREKTRKENYRHKWNFSAFRLLVFTTDTYLLKLYYEHFRLLAACVKKIPWIEDTVDEKYSFFHLEDVLTVFVNKEGEEPMMKLEPGQFDPPSYVRNRIKDDLLAADIEVAKALIEQNAVPEDKSSMDYCVYRLLTHGYDEEELLAWTVRSIRSASAMLDFRYTYNSGDETNNKDLDRVLIGEDDMNEAELEAYLN